MYDLKCPWQTVTTHVQERSYEVVDTVSFGDCLKTQCPFWQTEQKIGYDNIVEAHCTRAKGV